MDVIASHELSPSAPWRRARSMPQTRDVQVLDIVYYYKNAPGFAAKKTEQNIHSPGFREHLLPLIEQ
jgi:hypothetical protein